MKSGTRLIVFLLMIMFANNVLSQEKQYPEVTINNTEVRKIKSDFVKDMEYYIHITLPNDYQKSYQNYPVVYYTDAFYWGGIVIETYRLLRTNNEIPPMILVGISWDPKDGQGYYYRSRDFTPTHIPIEELPNWLKGFTPTSGGADNFLSFIEKELVPMIESNIRVDTSNRGLLGYSYGGLFSAYALFKRPDLFQHYFIGAPALFWDDYYVLNIEENLAKETKELPGRVFSAIGSEDGIDLLNSWIKLRDRLNNRGYKGLKFSYMMLDGENHFSAIPAVYSRAFRVLYGKN